MRALTLLFLLCAALLLVACGSSSNSGNAGGAGGGGGTTAGFTGVAACDEYLAKVEKCANSPNVPEEAKASFKQALSDQNREAWKKASSTPEGRAMLEKQCKSMMDFARTALDNYCK